ncbi:LytTR family DNA-binding domain-containing protein [Dyadobacter sp. CY356]|uniref:LytR/AlgR family response regulator transcription factor n=1 Tax=Dyadobacter sp. CY356 TaxID=2906442 RepID=UPI001F2E9994|nr:response regulator transcription factor [Dyadobacter sp. CY356]MCF0055225.1 response regulator transcription factor [Dyadobacter sp. CY356]
MKVKCLLVDDEPLAIQLIKNHLGNLDSFEVVASCSNAVKALEVLRSTQVDLLFLDIKMPKISGLDFLKALKNPPAVIITTAYREYALDGYELDLVDYLLKPITFDRFFKAIDRYLRRSAVISQAVQITDPQFLHIRACGKIHRLAVEQIIYIESMKDYLVFHLANQKIMGKYKIGDLEAEIQGNSFLRVHRSFLINTSKINSYTSTDVQIKGCEIPIGASYKEYVFKFLESSRLNK